MMRKPWSLPAVLVLFLLLMAVAVLIQPHPALAGFGNSTSYGGSFGGDLSGSGGMGGMSLLFLLPLLFRGGGSTVGVLIVIFVVYSMLRNKRGRIPGDFNPNRYDSQPAPVSIPLAGDGLDQLKQKDPNFSEAGFITRVNNMYMQLQDAWMKKDWKAVRPFETNELFNMHARQLQAFIDKHTTNMMEEICVLDTRISKYTSDGTNDEVDVVLKARLKDYVVDDTTRKVVEGDPHRENYITYLLKMIRKQGVLTKVDAEPAKVSHCPNCGADVSVNASGQCEYCGSVITGGQYDWVLAAVNVIDQS
jgi:ribosomal protein L37AE/L43A